MEPGRSGTQPAAMAASLQILTAWVLAAALSTSTALPQFGQEHADVAPVVVWAQMSTGESSDSDFQSRFGQFADQSEQADGSEKEVVAVWPGPAWQKSDSPAISERVGEPSEDLVASESSRADQLASYVTRLTEQGFSSGDQLSFDESPTQSDQNSAPAEAEERSDNVAAETNAHGFGTPKISRSDDDIDDNERQHSRQAVLRRRRKRPIASGDTSALRRRQRPTTDSDTSDKSENAVSSTTSEQPDGGAADSDTEALKQRRRRIGVRRRRPLHSQPNQQRRRPVQQTASAAEEPTTQRPSRRRRPTQPPATAAPAREQQSDSQSEGATKAVYFQPNPEEYPQYPPFAPREPTQAPPRPLQAAQPEYDDRQKSEAENQPSQFVSGLISNSARPDDDDDGSDDSNSLSQMVNNLKLKLTEEKEQNENEIASDSSALPSLIEEHATTRPLRELFDVLTRADLAKGSRSENYGPASLEETPDVPSQAATAPFQMPDIQPHQIHLPEQQNGRQRLRLQRPRGHPQRRPAGPQATSHSLPPQPAPATPTAERVVPSEVVYESGFSPIPSLSYFQAPSSPEPAGPPQHPAPAPPQHPAPLPLSPSTFVSGERRPTPVQSRPTFAPPRPRPTVHHTVQRPTHPPRPAPPPEEKAANGGKVRFPGPEEPINAQEFGPPKPTTLLGQPPSGGPHHRVPQPPPSADDRRRPLSGHLVAAPRPFGDSSHHTDNSSPSSVSGAVIAPTPLPPNQGPLVHPPQQHQNRPLTFGIKPTKRVPPKSFGGRPKPVFGRPHPDPSGHPPRGHSFEKRPPGPAINQLTPGPLSKDQHRLPPTTPGQNFDNRLPLQARPDDRHPPSQIPEQLGQQPRPQAPPRPPHGSPNFGQQKPSGSFQNGPTGDFQQKPQSHFQQRPQGDTLHYGDLQNRPLQGDLQQKQQGETTHTQQKPHDDFQQRPQNDFQHGPQGAFQQKPHNDFQHKPQGDFQQKPQGDIQQRPQGPFQRPQSGSQQGPQGDFQQRPPNHFQQKPQGDLQKRPHGDFQQRPQGPFQRPQGDLQKRPHGDFQQRPQGPFQRPQSDLQQGPPNGFERRPPQHGAAHDQGGPPFGFQQRPSGPGDQARPAPEMQHGPAGGDVQNRPPFPGQHRPPTSHDGQRPPTGHQQQQGPPPGFQQRPPPGFQQRPEHQQRPQPGQQQGHQQGHQQRPQPGHQQRPQPGFASRPPPGFRPGPAGPGSFGQHAPGSGLPSSAHPRHPSSGPLAHFSRRRDQQAPGQLMFQRG